MSEASIHKVASYFPMESKPHIALVSIPAFSHQVSILEFAKRLVHLHHDFHVTCIIPTLEFDRLMTAASKAFFQSLPSTIDYIHLPPVNIDDLQGIPVEVQLQFAVSRSMPFVRNALHSLNSQLPIVALVTDPLANQALEFAKELNVLSYVYFPSSAMSLSLCLYSTKLDETFSSEYRDQPEPIQIPGCVPIHGKDLPDTFQDRSSLSYKQFLQRCRRYRLADGVMFNSFLELEAQAIRAMQEEGSGDLPVYPIGPVIQTGSISPRNGSECLRWLGNQPPNSVLYVSFGSGGALSQVQLNELALGLELSRQKFFWVIARAPNDKASASYLCNENEDLLGFLPLGFLERTKGQGLVIPSWAPQMQVLSHCSTGGFLTHCGWNSSLESIVQGVPLIAWPLFAEQRTNAAMLTDGLKVALRPKANENGIVEKEEIAKVIKILMEGSEGEGIRGRMKELKEAAACAVMAEGSSTRSLSQLALQWKKSGGI